jgi:hypothetical protein
LKTGSGPKRDENGEWRRLHNEELIVCTKEDLDRQGM